MGSLRRGVLLTVGRGISHSHHALRRCIPPSGVPRLVGRECRDSRHAVFAAAAPLRGFAAPAGRRAIRSPRRVTLSALSRVWYHRTSMPPYPDGGCMGPRVACTGWRCRAPLGRGVGVPIRAAGGCGSCDRADSCCPMRAACAACAACARCGACSVHCSCCTGLRTRWRVCASPMLRVGMARAAAFCAGPLRSCGVSRRSVWSPEGWASTARRPLAGTGVGPVSSASSVRFSC